MFSVVRDKDNIDDFFDVFKGGHHLHHATKGRGHHGHGGLKMDIHETKNGYEAMFDVPGVPKDAVKISHEGQTLTVTVDHKEDKERVEKDKDGVKVHWRERRSGFMKRSVTMPDNCDFAKATAKQDHGVLTITFPKTTEGEHKKYIAIE